MVQESRRAVRRSKIMALGLGGELVMMIGSEVLAGALLALDVVCGSLEELMLVLYAGERLLCNPFACHVAELVVYCGFPTNGKGKNAYPRAP